mmetsp:Transcript_47395/g.107427  ORF Transcript_47395/g.107427 Transcript_47395/m.107427 type:complete len:222 (+) Transcript_47395:360-1025(+)
MFDRSREEAARQESYEYERAISMSNAQVTGGQDYDYLKSEMADRKKAIMRRKEAEDAAEAESMAEALKLSAESEAHDERRRCARFREMCLGSLPPEPPKGAPGSIAICFRLHGLKGGAGRRVERRFGEDDKLLALINFLRSREELEDVARWEVRSSQPSSQVLATSNEEGLLNATSIAIGSLGLGTRALLLVPWATRDTRQRVLKTGWVVSEVQARGGAVQ